jgi:hypothetical protein
MASFRSSGSSSAKYRQHYLGNEILEQLQHIPVVKCLAETLEILNDSPQTLLINVDFR